MKQGQTIGANRATELKQKLADEVGYPWIMETTPADILLYAEWEIVAGGIVGNKERVRKGRLMKEYYTTIKGGSKNA